MTRAEKLADSILRPINPTVIVILGAYTVLWGLWLVCPFWDVFSSAALFSAMSNIMGETAWGAVAIVSGIGVIHGALKPSYNNLIKGSLIGFFHWIIIGILYFAGDWMNTGGITAFTFAIYSAIIWLNIRVNRTHYKG